MSFWRFVVYDSICGAIWTVVMVLIGVLAGKGYGIVADVFKSVQIAGLFIVLFIVAYAFLEKWINKKLEKKG